MVSLLTTSLRKAQLVLKPSVMLLNVFPGFLVIPTDQEDPKKFLFKKTFVCWLRIWNDVVCIRKILKVAQCQRRERCQKGTKPNPKFL